MTVALIICTYMRPEALVKLLESVSTQEVVPNEILIVDGSSSNATKDACHNLRIENLLYYQVNATDRGLTKQRNYGIARVSRDIDVICFLDDDTILEPEYFKRLILTYYTYPDALGVGGYITNEVKWQKADASSSRNQFYYDGYMRKEPKRFRIREICGVSPDRQPCYLPSFGHGRSVSFLPPSGKTYKVEHFMGGVASFRKEVFDRLQFSSYFEGYGLYEDADFCFRLNRLGPLYVNTAARLEHHHAASGRPNWFRYGQMVITNGWYVWRIRYSNPKLVDKIKWRLCSLLLIGLTISRPSKRAISEGIGRLWAWIILFISKPKIQS